MSEYPIDALIERFGSIDLIPDADLLILRVLGSRIMNFLRGWGL